MPTVITEEIWHPSTYVGFAELYEKCPIGTLLFMMAQDTSGLLNRDWNPWEKKKEVKYKAPVPILGSDLQMVKLMPGHDLA